MKRWTIWVLTLAVTGSACWVGAQETPAASPAPAAASAEGVSAQDLLKQIEELSPKVDPARIADEDYRRELEAQQVKSLPQRAVLARRFIDAYPNDPRASEMVMLVLGAALNTPDAKVEDGVKIAQDIATRHGDTVAGLEAQYANVRLALQTPKLTYAQGKALIDAYAAKASGTAGQMRVERAQSDLIAAANDLDDARRQELRETFVKDHPQSQLTPRMKADLKLSQAIGKPFDISFEDAKTGKKIDSESLKGKIVVVDFWATWCGPCVAEMPNMKKLYAQYKDKGVEFVGVSLDAKESEGGKKKLLDFLEKNEIAWPQYYQGNGWESEFSRSWGINGIPTMFLIDHEGKLVSTEVRGKLEELIPKAIEKRDAAK